MSAMPLPAATLPGDRVHVKERFVAEMRRLHPALSEGTVFDVNSTTLAYGKAALLVTPVGGGDGLPTVLYAGTVKRVKRARAEREKALRAAGCSW